MTEKAPSQRLDVWLWQARFFKTRSRATRVCRGGGVRHNGQPVKKASLLVEAGDVLTFPQGDVTRMVRLCGLGQRRGPAAEAQTLYEDLTPPRPAKTALPKVGQRDRGAGRPTKAERRALDKWRGQ